MPVDLGTWKGQLIHMACHVLCLTTVAVWPVLNTEAVSYDMVERLGHCNRRERFPCLACFSMFLVCYFLPSSDRTELLGFGCEWWMTTSVFYWKCQTTFQRNKLYPSRSNCAEVQLWLKALPTDLHPWQTNHRTWKQTLGRQLLKDNFSLQDQCVQVLC